MFAHGLEGNQAEVTVFILNRRCECHLIVEQWLSLLFGLAVRLTTLGLEREAGVMLYYF